jgi:signal transduction histidine kinase
MKLKKARALRWYFHLFNFVAKERIKKNDIDRREIHTQLAVVLSTGVLMWAYAFLAYFTISSPVPGVVGFASSIVHILSPLLYRFTNRTYFISNVLLTAGMAHQGTYAYYSGGFESTILIWFGILPMIGGVTSGRRGAVTWLYFSIMVSLTFFTLHINGHQFPKLISPLGRLWSQALLVFGWIFLSSTIVIVYSELREHTEQLLHDQGKKIDDLFRVLFHDLANPLGRIAIGLSIAKKQLPNGESNRGLEIAKLASDSMMEITQNIRRMYAVSKGKANVDLTLTPLNSAVDYIMKLYAAELERKQVRINYHFDKNLGLRLMVEPVSFNNQVLGNIISNAIKFSKPGGQIYLTAYPIDHDSFTIEIKDNGIGIPQILVSQLFDFNKKTTRPGTNGESGTGFGMHIMKSFVEMYGGEILIESKEEGQNVPSGTTVRLVLKGEWT